ncbi:DUF3306 domain-containing protein [Fulvimarina sp. MAC3]|uniref:DUF3306 domain-containing protein n=1 Tax=Fulvimarina sp. MAC3 TaxID=3148887 RepID=UPI0031FDA270
MAEGETEGSFLSRWSRRKRAVVEEEAASEIAPAEDHADDPEALAEAEARFAREAEELAEMELNRQAAEAIDIETLQKGDDFSAFFKKGVPQLLKRQAMRKLWTTNPVFANLDGLNDYDEDFRNPAHNVYKSLWQAGRGFLSEAEQTAQQLTGRLRIGDDASGVAAASEPPEVIAENEAVDQRAEAGLAENTGEAHAEADGAEPVLSIAEVEAEPGTAEVEPDIAEAAEQKPQPDEEEPAVRRRVSLRRRLAG